MIKDLVTLTLIQKALKSKDVVIIMLFGSMPRDNFGNNIMCRKL